MTEPTHKSLGAPHTVKSLSEVRVNIILLADM